MHRTSLFVFLLAVASLAAEEPISGRLATRDAAAEWTLDTSQGYDPQVRGLRHLPGAARGMQGLAAQAWYPCFVPTQISPRAKTVTRRVVTGRLHVKGLDAKGIQAALGGWKVPVRWFGSVAIVEARPSELLRSLALLNQLGVAGIDAEFESVYTVQTLATVDDPSFGQQWHLVDMNVPAAWDSVTGSGVTLAVVDQGVEASHEDLTAHVRTDIDIDIIDGDTDTSPNTSGEAHGTWVSGVAAAVGDNGTGVAGVAYDATVIPVRLLGAGSTDLTTQQIADAFVYRLAPGVGPRIDVSNNSWGPGDLSPADSAQPLIIREALEDGALTGRNGLGVVYVFAAGNGRNLIADDPDTPGDDSLSDDSSWDWLANSPFTMGIGALGRDGLQAFYSESGCNVFLSAPGGGGANGGIVTTDRVGAAGDAAGNYSSTSGNVIGTSFASPAVSGVVCLMLEAKPNLTWRDVRHILRITAADVDLASPTWQINGSGQRFHHGYGFGQVDAGAAVALAASPTWVMAPPSVAPITRSSVATVSIPDNDAVGITRTLTFSDTDIPDGFRIETVELTVDVDHTFSGDLDLRLTAPSGMETRMPARWQVADSLHHTFVSNAHVGENGQGQWSFRIRDLAAIDTGKLKNWSIRLRGYDIPEVPVLVTVSPGRIAPGAGDTVLTVSGSQFAQTSVVTWNGSDLTTTFVSATTLTAVVPAAALATPDVGTVGVTTPAFLSEGGGSSGTRTVVVSSEPTIAATPNPIDMAEDAIETVTLTLTDVDNSLDSLVVTATSDNLALVSNQSLRLSGTGGTRTLTVTPIRDRSGTATITVTVSDGGPGVSEAIPLTVNAVNDRPVVVDQTLSVATTGIVNGQWQVIDPEGDVWTTSETTPSGLTITLLANGAFSFDAAALSAAGGVALWQVAASDGGGAGLAGTALLLSRVTGPRPYIVGEPLEETVAPATTFHWALDVDRREISVSHGLRYRILQGPAGLGFGSDGGPLSVDVAAPGDSAMVEWTVTGNDRIEPIVIQVQGFDGGDVTAADVIQIALRVRSLAAVE